MSRPLNFAAFLPHVKRATWRPGRVVDDPAWDSHFITNFQETAATQQAVHILLLLAAQPRDRFLGQITVATHIQYLLVWESEIWSQCCSEGHLSLPPAKRNTGDGENERSTSCEALSAPVAMATAGAPQVGPPFWVKRGSVEERRLERVWSMGRAVTGSPQTGPALHPPIIVTAASIVIL